MFLKILYSLAFCALSFGATSQICINWQEECKKSQPVQQNFTVSYKIEKLQDRVYDLITTITPGEGAYYASPFSMNDWTGLFDVKIDPSHNIQVKSGLVEVPQSERVADPSGNFYANWVHEKTSYHKIIGVKSSNTFSVKGYCEFVIEPECNRYEVGFQLNYKDGKLTVQKTTTIKANKTL